jgi:hypothetical protein
MSRGADHSYVHRLRERMRGATSAMRGINSFRQSLEVHASTHHAEADVSKRRLTWERLDRPQVRAARRRAATAQSTHESFSDFPVSSVDGEGLFALCQITRVSLIAFPRKSVSAVANVAKNT